MISPDSQVCALSRGYLNCEHTLVSIAVTFPFSAYSAQTAHLGGYWVDWKKITATRQHSSSQMHTHLLAAATSFTNPTHPLHTHNNEFAPLASQVESSEIIMRSCQPMRRGPRTLYEHCTNILRTFYVHCTNIAPSLASSP